MQCSDIADVAIFENSELGRKPISEQKVENIFVTHHIANPPIAGSFKVSLLLNILNRDVPRSEKSCLVNDDKFFRPAFGNTKLAVVFNVLRSLTS